VKLTPGLSLLVVDDHGGIVLGHGELERVPLAVVESLKHFCQQYKHRTSLRFRPSKSYKGLSLTKLPSMANIATILLNQKLTYLIKIVQFNVGNILSDLVATLQNFFFVTDSRTQLTRALVPSKFSSGQSNKTGGQCYKTFYGRKLRIFVISQSICPLQAFQLIVTNTLA
jgi:hypothetical protein